MPLLEIMLITPPLVRPNSADIPLVCTLNSSVESTVRNVMGPESTILSLAMPSTRKPFVKGCPPPMLTAARRQLDSTWPPKYPMPLTVGIRFARPIGLRPFSGNSITLRSSITVPSDDVLGSSSGEPPVTSTVSLTCPSCMPTGTASDRSTSTMMPSRRNDLKPGAVTCNE